MSIESEQSPTDTEENYEYELIGVTVHTGTADGGHYYSFIRDRSFTVKRDKWFLFNDAEVKQFDPNQIPGECFGGEMTVIFGQYEQWKSSISFYFRNLFTEQNLRFSYR